MAPKVLIVLTSHAKIENHDREIGWWLSELAHPYDVLAPKAEIAFASPKGGIAPVDPHSTGEPYTSDPISMDFLNNKKHLWYNTQPLSSFAGRADDFDAIFYPGGHGPMFDLATNPVSIQLVQEFYTKGKVVAAVCHGPAAFVNVTLPDGKHILDGKEVTGLSNAEEDAIQTSHMMPFLLETRLREASGGKFSAGAPMTEKVIVQDGGRFITGQNPPSARAVGEAIAKALGE